MSDRVDGSLLRRVRRVTDVQLLKSIVKTGSVPRHGVRIPAKLFFFMEIVLLHFIFFELLTLL